MQTKTGSIIEVILNVGSGMVIAYFVVQFFGVGILGIQIHPIQNITLTITLTGVSIVRSYLWRRFFASHYKEKEDEL